MKSPGSDEVTRFLAELESGDSKVVAKLLPLVYRELHDIAENALRKERRDHTLQPTALINEAYLRLIGQRSVRWQNRAHFVGVAATVMRRILVDYARAQSAKKRGGSRARITLEDAAAKNASTEVDVEALDAALQRLAQLDARQARMVELRFFGGLGIEETAAVLEVSVATVKREWSSAKAWLKRELG